VQRVTAVGEGFFELSISAQTLQGGGVAAEAFLVQKVLTGPDSVAVCWLIRRYGFAVPGQRRCR
jgi:hypothetical protein